MRHRIIASLIGALALALLPLFSASASAEQTVELRLTEKEVRLWGEDFIATALSCSPAELPEGSLWKSVERQGDIPFEADIEQEDINRKCWWKSVLSASNECAGGLCKFEGDLPDPIRFAVYRPSNNKVYISWGTWLEGDTTLTGDLYRMEEYKGEGFSIPESYQISFPLDRRIELVKNGKTIQRKPGGETVVIDEGPSQPPFWIKYDPRKYITNYIINEWLINKAQSGDNSFDPEKDLAFAKRVKLGVDITFFTIIGIVAIIILKVSLGWMSDYLAHRRTQKELKRMEED
jgi:hypothetical protein